MSLHKLLLKDPQLYELTCELITKLSGVEPEREKNNFGKCLDFAVSNFLYHRHVEPDEANVGKFYEGLEEKFRIHALHDKAEDLKTLLTQFSRSPFFNEETRGHVEQGELRLRLLSFLAHMSEDPLHSEWSGPTIPETEDLLERDRDKINYRALLQEGEIPYRAESPSDLSEWSESEPEDVDLSMMEDIKPAFKANVYRDLEEPALKYREQNVIDAEHWLATHIMHCPVLTTVEEFELMCELVWHLREPLMAESSLFLFETNNVRLKEGISTPQMGHKALNNFLQDFMSNLMQLREIQAFCNNFFCSNDCSGNDRKEIPMTLEAYANSLRVVFDDFNRDLIDLEADLSNHSLLQLREKLRPWFHVWRRVSEVHQRTGVSTPASTNPQNQWRQVCVLIAILGEVLCRHFSDIKLFNIVVRLFCDTCKPYLQLMGNWMIKGQLDDLKHEFVFFTKNNDSNSAQFDWFSDVQTHPYEVMLVHRGLYMPSLFSKRVLNMAQLAAKSQRLLNSCTMKYGEDTDQRKNVAEPQNTELSKDFQQRLIEEISKFQAQTGVNVQRESEGEKVDDARPTCNAQISSGVGIKRMDLSNEDFLNENSLDPFLSQALSLALNINSSKTTLTSSKDLEDCTEDSWPLIDPLVPVDQLIERAVMPFISSIYRRNSDRLLDLVQRKLDLKRHLSLVRKVFLMEAGDVMFEFTSALFSTIENDSAKDSTVNMDNSDASELLLTLHQCLGRRFSTDECQRFYLHPDLRLSYNVDWPLNIVLDAKRLDMYNDIFNFMLRVKWALWSLEQIEPKEMSQSSAALHMSRTEKNAFIHRVLLLKAWLFHFMTSVHAYFMTRVLHSTEYELVSSLDSCVDLDDLVAVHEAYVSSIHDRCFLHKSASALKECVINVADICHALKVASDGELDQLEQSYSRSHHLLSSTLDGMIRRRTVPHLLGLAAALRHSAPKLVKQGSI